jgi:hypothetical protein
VPIWPNARPWREERPSGEIVPGPSAYELDLEQGSHPKRDATSSRKMEELR